MDSPRLKVRVLTGPLQGGVGNIIAENGDTLTLVVSKDGKLTPPVAIDRANTEPYVFILPWRDHLVAIAGGLSFFIWALYDSTIALACLAVTLLIALVRMHVLHKRMLRSGSCPECATLLDAETGSKCGNCGWTRPMPVFNNE
jgi:hypothetical protein